MQTVTTIREEWAQRVRDLGLTTKTISIATKTSTRSVRAYREGTRRPSDDWLIRVATLIACVEPSA